MISFEQFWLSEECSLQNPLFLLYNCLYLFHQCVPQTAYRHIGINNQRLDENNFHAHYHNKIQKTFIGAYVITLQKIPINYRVVDINYGGILINYGTYVVIYGVIFRTNILNS